MYELLKKLEALIEKWENAPYTGDYTKAAKAVCAKELRVVLGSPDDLPNKIWLQDTSSNDAVSQRGRYEEEPLPF